MAVKTKKIDKEFLITDSSVNVYEFRLLTEGYLIDEYKKNPIGYHMHLRDDGVVVRWEDFRIDGDKVYAKPVINLSNKRGQQTVDEIENGFLNGASVGHLVVLEWSDDPEKMLPGQSGPTITKWYNRETSLCDVPGNKNALALFDKDGHPINLSDLKKQTPIMKQIILTAEQLTKLNLKSDSDSAAVDAVIGDLTAKAATVDKLTTDLAAANTGKKTAEDALEALKKSTVEKEVNDLADNAAIEKRCTKEAAEQLKVDYKNNPAGLKSLVATMKPYVSIADRTGDNKDVADLAAKGWDALDKEGKLDDLKASNIGLFKEIFKAKFGTEYTDKK